MDESEIKTSRFSHVSGDFESGIQSGNFESGIQGGNIESGKVCRVNDFLWNPDIFPPANV